MARGNAIIVTENPRGVFQEGVVATGETFYPGMAVTKDPTVALKGGRHTYKKYNADADGGRPKGAIWIVTHHIGAMMGKTATDAIAAGERVQVYSPLPGEELNLLLGDVSGTADDHVAGEILIIDDTTGEFIATTGSPETECAMLLESVTDPTADQLAWCEWTGY